MSWVGMEWGPWCIRLQWKGLQHTSNPSSLRSSMQFTSFFEHSAFGCFFNIEQLLDCNGFIWKLNWSCTCSCVPSSSNKSGHRNRVPIIIWGHFRRVSCSIESLFWSSATPCQDCEQQHLIKRIHSWPTVSQFLRFCVSSLRFNF